MLSASLMDVTEETKQLTINRIKLKKNIEKKKWQIVGVLWIIHVILSITEFIIGTVYAGEDCRENINKVEIHIDALLRVHGIYIFSATQFLLVEFIASHYIKINVCIAFLSLCLSICIIAVDIGFIMLILAFVFGDPERCEEESKQLYDLGLAIIIINTTKYLISPCLGCPCFQRKNN